MHSWEGDRPPALWAPVRDLPVSAVPPPPALSFLQWEVALTAGPRPGEEGGASGPHRHDDHGRQPSLLWARSILQAPGRGAPLGTRDLGAGGPRLVHSALDRRRSPGAVSTLTLWRTVPQCVLRAQLRLSPTAAWTGPEQDSVQAWAEPPEAPAETEAALSRTAPCPPPRSCRPTPSLSPGWSFGVTFLCLESQGCLSPPQALGSRAPGFCCWCRGPRAAAMSRAMGGGAVSRLGGSLAFGAPEEPAWAPGPLRGELQGPCSNWPPVPLAP